MTIGNEFEAARSTAILALKGCLLAASAMSTAAYAQTPAADEAKSGQPDEILVTGSKFGSTIARAAVSATSVSEAELQRDRIQTVQDVAVRVPSLVYNNPSSFAQAYIRGLGSNYSLAGLESAVATYVDGFYLQRQNGAVLDLVDLAGVEVLKGPQGTLYGRNATGGVILVQTADPKPEFGGFMNGEYGRFNQFRGQAAINIPISDTLAVRFAGQVMHNDDYLKGVGGAPDAGRTDSAYGRFKLRWAPTPEFTAIYSLERYTFKSTAFAQRQNLPNPYCQICGIYDQNPPLNEGFYTTSQSGSGVNRVRYTSQTLNLKYATDDFTISSMTGLRNQRTPLANDQEYMPPEAFTAHVEESGPNFQNDTFIRTTFQSPLNVLLGFSVMRERNTQRVAFTGDFTSGLDVRNVNRVKVDSVSLYGEATYNFGQGFKLSAGARWNQDKKSIAVTNNPGAVLLFGLPSSLAAFKVNATFRSVTPRAVLSYESGDMFFYASYNRGERSGGFGSPVLAPGAAVRPERLDNYEIGLKGKLLNGLLTINSSAFYGDYKNIQVQIVDSSTGTVKLQNAAKGRVSGFEFDARLAPMRNLNLSGGFTILDNKFKSFANANVFVPFASYPTPSTYGLDGSKKQDLTGAPLPRSPKFSGYLAGDYTTELGAWSVRFSAIARHSSRFDFSAGAGGPLRNDQQRAYTKVDGAIDVRLPNGSTEVGFYASNIFDARYYEIVQTATYGGFYVAPMPPSYGLRISQNF